MSSSGASAGLQSTWRGGGGEAEGRWRGGGEEIHLAVAAVEKDHAELCHPWRGLSLLPVLFDLALPLEDFELEEDVAALSAG